MKVTCGHCGRKTEEGAFCEKCGARLVVDDGDEAATVPPKTGGAAEARPAEASSPARPAAEARAAEPAREARAAAGGHAVSDGGAAVELEWDKLCVLCEGVAGILRFRVLPRGGMVRNLELWVERPSGGERLKTRQVRYLWSAREMAVTVPPPAVAGAGVWTVGVEYDDEGGRRRFEGDFHAVVTKREEARQTVGELSVTINNNIQSGNASDVNISQRAVDDLVRTGGTNPLQALQDLVKSDARVWKGVDLDETGGTAELPPCPDGAKCASVVLDMGGTVVHFHSGRELTVGRQRKKPGREAEGCDIALTRPVGTLPKNSPALEPYWMLSRRHCTLRASGGKVRIDDGCREAGGAWKASTAGICWNGAWASGGVELAKGTSGVLALGRDRRSLALEVRVLDDAEEGGGGLAAWLWRKREDGVSEHHVGLWGAFRMGDIEPRLADVVVFPRGGGFAWRRGQRCGWLLPGTKLPTDAGIINVN